MSTIVQNPKELRQQFLLLAFLLSIFRRNFNNTYYSCLFYCPNSVGISTTSSLKNKIMFSSKYFYRSQNKIMYISMSKYIFSVNILSYFVQFSYNCIHNSLSFNALDLFFFWRKVCIHSRYHNTPSFNCLDYLLTHA